MDQHDSKSRINLTDLTSEGTQVPTIRRTLDGTAILTIVNNF